MATISIEFNFSDGSVEYAEFDANSGLVMDIEDYKEDLLFEKNDELEDDSEKIDLDDWEVHSIDLDFADQQCPSDFDDLDDWGEYCEYCDEYGNAYCLRYADIGENYFEDEYQGCHESFLDFIYRFVDDCYNFDSFTKKYFDYEKFAEDISCDFSTYEDSDGIHVFKN